MTDLMNAKVVEPAPRADSLPRPVDVGHVPAGLAWQGFQDADRRRGQVSRAGASFPVGEMKLDRFESGMLPALVDQKLRSAPSACLASAPALQRTTHC